MTNAETNSDTSIARGAEGRIAKFTRHAREIRRDPATVIKRPKDWAVQLWITKGGGFYGLGYVIAFVALETRSLSGDLSGAESMAGFLASQFIQFVIRFSIESFLNVIYAAMWPFVVLQSLQGWGLAVLIAAYVGYRSLADRHLHRLIPELRTAKMGSEGSVTAP